MDNFPSLTAIHDATTPSNSFVSLETIGVIDFDLGNRFIIDGLSFWNQNLDGPDTGVGVSEVEFLYSNDGVNFTTILGAPTSFAEVIIEPATPETFSFDAVFSTYIRMTVQNNHNNAGGTGFAEIAFSGSVQPIQVITQDIVVELDSDGNASITAEDIDNGSTAYDGADLGLDISSFSCSNLGENTVTLTVADSSGNQATATATVTVVDNISSDALCVEPFTIELDANGQANISALEIDAGSTDNCDIASIEIDRTSFDCTDLTTSSSDSSVCVTCQAFKGNIGLYIFNI